MIPLSSRNCMMTYRKVSYTYLTGFSEITWNVSFLAPWTACMHIHLRKFHMSLRMCKRYGIGTLFHIWNENVFTYEIPSSLVKWTDWAGSKFHLWNLHIWKMYFTYEMKHSVMKFSFLHVKPKQFAWNIILTCGTARQIFVTTCRASR